MSRKPSKTSNEPRNRSLKTLAIIADLRTSKPLDEIALQHGVTKGYLYSLRHNEKLTKPKRRNSRAPRKSAKLVIVPAPAPAPALAPAPAPAPVVVFEPTPMPPARISFWQRVKAVFTPA